MSSPELERKRELGVEEVVKETDKQSFYLKEGCSRTEKRVQLLQFDGGAATVPAAFQLSTPELIQVYERVAILAGSRPLPDSRPGSGAPRRATAGRGAAQVLPGGSERVFRIPELLSPGRANQALTPSWFSKEV